MGSQYEEQKHQNEILLEELQKRLEKVKSGGGQKKVLKEHEKGKWTARERIDFLLDAQTEYFEIGALAADGVYEGEGGCPSAGVVTILGKVKGRLCVMVANDATVKSGAWFPMTAKKTCAPRKWPWKTICPLFTW